MVLLAVLMVFTSGISQAEASSADASALTSRTDVPATKMQALVMDMADRYIASLGESVYLLTRSDQLDRKGRWLAQSFLRNGVGASLDIAVGPNPPVNLLDLLVLVSLQAWSFEVHWIPAGIGDAGIPALDRLKQAERDAWDSAGQDLSAEQKTTLRELINRWIAENPNRTVVSLVRFDEFADERRISSLSLRRKARGLLRQVSEASTAVDEARLLGERLLWFAGRYPYLLGEQAELTSYRLIDQPEISELFEAVQSLRGLSEALTERIQSIQRDLADQQVSFFSQVSAERVAAIRQTQSALKAIIEESLEQAAQDIGVQRKEAIDQLFGRIARERKQALDDLASRKDELQGMMTELRETISASGTLARELTGTVGAIDRVVSRFDIDPSSEREPLRMEDLRDAAVEAGKAADRTTNLINRLTELVESKALDRQMSGLRKLPETIINQVFWRGAILICLLLAGIGLLRRIPQRKS